MLCLSSLSGGIVAQQLSTFTQYRDLQTIINPGAIPIDYFVYNNEPTLLLGGTWREQWNKSGIEGAPSTKILSVDFLPPDREGVSLFAGGHLLLDQNGIFETTGGYGKLGAVMDLYTGKVSLGLSLGFVQNRLQFRPGANPGAIEDEFSGISPEVGVGVFYKHDFQRRSGFFYAGLSVPQVIGFSNTLESVDSSIIINQVQHLYGTLGMVRYRLDDVAFEPSIWIKYVPNTPLTVDINVRFQLADQFSIMGGYSIGSESIQLSFNLLLKWDNALLKFGLGFSPSFANYGATFGNTFEPLIQYIY